MNNKQEQAEIFSLQSNREFVKIGGSVYPLLSTAELSLMWNGIAYMLASANPELFDKVGGLVDKDNNPLPFNEYLEKCKDVFDKPPYNDVNFLKVVMGDLYQLTRISQQAYEEASKPQPKIITIH